MYFERRLGLFNYYVSHLGGGRGSAICLFFLIWGKGGGKTYFLTLTGRGVLIYGSSREYSCIMVRCIGWGVSGTICIFLGGGSGELGEG